ncbi:16S rRNA (cytosine(1402)-N(4))-methyltransferase RsmH [bacterium]|nr:16S rRNA (cytosine(1402)-N(4))-methyltransferase RsmH [bacterium]
MERAPAEHEPVLTKEVLQFLAPKPGDVIVDGTLGGGGHSLAILRQLDEEGLLVGADWDPQMLEAARKRIEAAHVAPTRYRLLLTDHAHLLPVLAEVLAEAGVQPAAPDGFLYDLGPSNPQILDPARGLSWESDEALDMRLSPQNPGPSAADIVNEWTEEALSKMIFGHSDERWARRIAARIVEARKQGPIRTGRQLAEIVKAAIPRKAWPEKIHPATRLFLALRIEVNQELERLERILPESFELLRPGGRLVVITFHSGEDRRVKDFMKRMATAPRPPWPLPETGEPARAKLLTPKPIGPGEEEIQRNPRSRSAKLRAIQKQ